MVDEEVRKGFYTVVHSFFTESSQKSRGHLTQNVSCPSGLQKTPSLIGTRYLGEPLSPAFSWEAEAVVNDSRIVQPSPPTVESDVQLWGYIATIPRIARAGDGGPEVLRVRLRVLHGAAGVGLVNTSNTSFVDAIDGLTAPFDDEVTFLIEDIREIGALVIRNASEERVCVEWLGAESATLNFPDEFDDRDLQKLVPCSDWNRYYGHFSRNAAEWIRQFEFDRLRAPRVMRWRDGLRIVITPGDETSRAVFVSGMYEPAVMLVLRRLLLRGAVFVDVGAQIGLYTLLGSRWTAGGGHVYSFEPSSRELAVLRENVELNDLRNVTVTAAAVHERAGRAVLHIASADHRGQNTLASSFGYEGIEEDGQEAVDLVTLDDLWTARHWRRPDVIKIDAEGAELHVLRGAAGLLRDARPAVVFEVNETLLRASGASVDEVGQFFKALDYQMYRVDDSSGELRRVPTIVGEDSENFVAFPCPLADRGERLW